MSKKKITIAAIAAVAENGVIGSNNGMPWHLPSEFAYFRRTTLGKPVIMGRKSFDALGGQPLPNRPNIVVTRNTSWAQEGVFAAPNLTEAIATARRIAVGRDVDTIFIIGGAEIYREALPLVDTLYLTEVHLKPEGDTFFPEFDRSAFTEIIREHSPAREDEEAAYTITVLERQRA